VSGQACDTGTECPKLTSLLYLPGVVTCELRAMIHFKAFTSMLLCQLQ